MRDRSRRESFENPNLFKTFIGLRMIILALIVGAGIMIMQTVCGEMAERKRFLDSGCVQMLQLGSADRVAPSGRFDVGVLDFVVVDRAAGADRGVVVLLEVGEVAPAVVGIFHFVDDSVGIADHGVVILGDCADSSNRVIDGADAQNVIVELGIVDISNASMLLAPHVIVIGFDLDVLLILDPDLLALGVVGEGDGVRRPIGVLDRAQQTV